METKRLTIKAYHAKGGGANWLPLPETSEYLTAKQLVPNVGDGLTLAGNDGKHLKLEPAEIEHIQTVKRRWFNYADCDVAVLVHYEAW